MKNIKLLHVFFFTFLSTVSFGQTFLKEGKIEFPYKKNSIYVSGQLPDKVGEVNGLANEKPLLGGYFLFLLPPKFELVEKTLEVEMDTSTFPLDEMTIDSFEYEVAYISKEGYFFPKISKRKLDKNCISADPNYAIALEFEEIEPEINYRKVFLSKKNLRKGKKTVTIKYEYKKIILEPQVIVSKTFDTKLTENLVYNKMLFLNGNYWSEFREMMCPCMRGLISIKPIQRTLREKGYKVIINGIIDSFTRDAIVDFQKKNNLPTGRLDIDTLRKLEINDEKPIKRYEYIQPSERKN